MTSPPRSRTFLALLPAIGLALLAAGVGAADLRPAPPTGEMAVVFPPWVGEVSAIRGVLAAGGRISGGSRLGNIVIAFADRPGFAGRVKDHGAWLTFAATGLCGPVTPSLNEQPT